MINRVFSSFLLCVFLGFVLPLSSQSDVVYIFSDDEDQDQYFESGTLTFKNSLPDGEYALLNIKRQDSGKVKLDEHIIRTGRYVDRLKDGRFETYIYSFKGNYLTRLFMNFPYEYKLVSVRNYSQGIPDGYQFGFNFRRSHYVEGFYKQGEKHGFFIYYKKDVFINENMKVPDKIEFYKKGELLYRSEFDDGEMIHFIDFKY